MSISVNSKTYNFDTTINRDLVQYDGPANTISIKDILQARRSRSAATTDFSGMARSSIKLTRTVTDGTDVVGDAIVEISVAFPVDGQASEHQAMLDDLGAWAVTASATGLFLEHDINQ
jgi:hypothetical protein